MNVIEFFEISDELYKEALKPVCSKYNVSYMEMTIILFLGNNPTLDKASDIVEKRHIAKSHVSSTIKTLMDKKLIEGQCYENDRRSIHLKLLPNALPILKDGQKAQRNHLAIYTKDLSVDEIAILKNIFDKMENNLLEKKREMKNGK